MSDKQSKKGLKKYGKRYTPQFRKKVVKEIENGEKTFSEVIRTYNGVRIDIWTHFMRGCIIDYVH